MWAAQFFGFEEPNRWMTSGGLGTMGYGLPAALGVQVAHPDALVIDIAGEASVQMTMQEMSTAVQYELPIKIFILNNSIWAWCASGRSCCMATAIAFLFRSAAGLRQAGRCLRLRRPAGDQAARSRWRDQ
jgi:thiamine pyrophosphate-dependent acetolactate synthase large subunit-like protein